MMAGGKIARDEKPHPLLAVTAITLGLAAFCFLPFLRFRRKTRALCDISAGAAFGGYRGVGGIYAENVPFVADSPWQHGGDLSTDLNAAK